MLRILFPRLSLSSAGALMMVTRPLKKWLRLILRASLPVVRPWLWRAKERVMKWKRCSRTWLGVGMGMGTVEAVKNDCDTVEAHSCVDIVTKFTDEQYTTINQSTAGRFDPRVSVNCLQVSHL